MSEGSWFARMYIMGEPVSADSSSTLQQVEGNTVVVDENDGFTDPIEGGIT